VRYFSVAAPPPALGMLSAAALHGQPGYSRFISTAGRRNQRSRPRPQQGRRNQRWFAMGWAGACRKQAIWWRYSCTPQGQRFNSSFAKENGLRVFRDVDDFRSFRAALPAVRNTPDKCSAGLS
jgi:hypothetical protein